MPPTVAEPGGVPRDAARPPAGLVWTLALALSLCVALSLTVMSIAMLSLPAQSLPAPFPSQHQNAENVSFIFAFLVALPLGIFLARRIAAQITSGPGPGPFARASLAAAGSLLACLLVLRIVGKAADGHVLVVQLFLMLAWIAAVSVGLDRAAGRGRESAPLAGPRPEWVLATIALAAAVAVFGVVDLDGISWLTLALGLLAVAAIDQLTHRGVPRLGSLPHGWLLDVVVVLVIVFAVPNLRIFDPADPFQGSILQFHQDLFLGPAERVLGGYPILAGTVSQYGVGSIDLIAGWFHVAPLGNATLGLLEGLLSAAMFLAVFASLRIAGVGRLLAYVTILIALLACVFALQYPLGGLLQHGAIRFGLPAGVVLGATVSSRWPNRRRLGLILQVGTLGLASIWALETFVYTAITLAAVFVTQATLVPRADVRGWLARRVAVATAAVLATQILFALVVLAATGGLPHWGDYLSIVKAFLVGKVGDLTYDFEPFSPAFAVGFGYLASIAGIVLISLRGGARAPSPVKLIALGAATGWGIALFTYFLNRSAPHILAYVSLPALLMGALWISVLLDANPDRSSPRRRLGIVVAGSTAALLAAIAVSTSSPGFSNSALAIAAPGGESLGTALNKVWYPPPINPAAPSGVRLLDRYMPEQKQSLILTSADLGIEILARSHRINTLPFNDPWEDSFVPDSYEGAIRSAIADLRPGDRALIDQQGLDLVSAYRRQPDRDPVSDPFSREAIVPSGQAPLQELVLKLIGERFDLRPIAKSPDGLEVVELQPRRG